MKKQTAKNPDDREEVLALLATGVTPLRDPGRVIHTRTKRKPIPEQRLRDEQAVLVDSLSDHITWDVDVESGEELVYLRAGLARDTLRKLRRGHWVIQDELDLHGMTALEARPTLVAFLQDCLRNGARCVRIIHGKGLRSKNREPVLKTKVANWLIQREEVLAFCQARRVEGGSGAVVVLLKAGGRRR